MRTKEQIREAKLNASAAKRVLNEPAAVEAFETLEKRIFDIWSKTPLNDTQTRENLFHQLQGLRAFKNNLKKTIEGAKLLDKNLTKPKDKEPSIASFFKAT